MKRIREWKQWPWNRGKKTERPPLRRTHLDEQMHTMCMSTLRDVGRYHGLILSPSQIETFERLTGKQLADVTKVMEGHTADRPSIVESKMDLCDSYFRNPHKHDPDQPLREFVTERMAQGQRKFDERARRKPTKQQDKRLHDDAMHAIKTAAHHHEIELTKPQMAIFMRTSGYALSDFPLALKDYTTQSQATVNMIISTAARYFEKERDITFEEYFNERLGNAKRRMDRRKRRKSGEQEGKKD